MKIKAIVFDYGGVMTLADRPYKVFEVVDELGLDRGAIERGYQKYRAQFDGDFISLKRLYELTWADEGVALDESVLDRFARADAESWLERNERTLEWMKALKARGFAIGILTNMPSSFAREHFRKTFADYIALANAVVISGEERLYKPQPEIYALMVHRLGCEPGELCFIDDVEKNIVAARQCGWRAVRFLNNVQAAADLDALLAEET